MSPKIALNYDPSISNQIFFKLSDSSSNFSLNSVSVTGGTLKYFGGVNDTYSAFFYLTANSSIGNAVIKVASGAFTDKAGNANADGADADNTITIPVPPTIAVTYDPSTSRVNFKLSGSSPNFSLNSVTVTGGTLKYFGGVHNTFAAMFFPDEKSTANGTIKVSSGAFTDDAGNANADGADADNAVTIVNTNLNSGTPKVALTYDATTSKIDFKLSKFSPNFSIDSVTVTGGTLKYFGGVNDTFGAMFYQDETSTANGIIKVASGAFTDAAGNANADGADADNTVIVINTKVGANSLNTNTTNSTITTNTITGTANNDTLQGTSSNDSINGGEGNDVLIGGAGNDSLYGGKGTDTAQYSGAYSNFAVTALYAGKNGAFSGYQVKDSTGAEGTDTVSTDVEFLTFNNNQTKVSLSASGTITVVSSTATTKNAINGTTGNDNLVGTQADDLISSGAGNDFITGSAGNDTIDGGIGVDTLTYAGTYANFKVANGANGALTLTNSKFGSDSITSVERFKFSDKCFANDVSGSAGNAVKVITAAFGKSYVPQFLSIGLTLTDSGQSLDALCETVTNAKLVESISGDGSTSGYVTAIYKNVVGRSPNVLESSSFISMIDTGSISRLDLLKLAAKHSMVSDTVNSLNVELLGIPYDPGF